MRPPSRRQYGLLFAWLGGPMRRLGNLGRYCDRMGVLETDAELVGLVRRAFDAVHRLSVHCHYRSCDHVGGADRCRADADRWLGDGI